MIQLVPQWVPYGLPVSAGVALYVAATDLVPEVNREPGIRMALVFFAGVAGFLLLRMLCCRNSKKFRCSAPASVSGYILFSVAHCVAPVLEAVGESRSRRKRLSFEFPGVLLFTVLGFLVMGYHPGLEDDGVYLPAVKAHLNPALFPYNANFFRLQMQATVVRCWMADFVRWTRMPLAWAELVWQLAALFLILWAVKKIANLLFSEESARWGAVALVAAMFTLPVAGTALNMADQHLHPRNLATAMILLAVWRILDGKRWQAVPLLLVAFLMHPLMAAMGISFCLVLTMALLESVGRRLGALRSATAAVVPLGWVFAPANPTWREALDTRTYYYLYQWTWYEWLGALAPLILFGLLWRMSRANVEKLCWRDLRRRYFSMRCSNRRWPWLCCGPLRWCG